MPDYTEVTGRITALCEGETDVIACMASIACELNQEFDHYDWVGFYRVTEPQLLKIGPYQGTHGCLTIPFDRGVCGAAAKTGTTQIVADVNSFPGHIACSTTTQSEIVVPVFGPDGQLFGVLDVDSNQPDAFCAEDAEALEAICAAVFGRPGMKP